VPRRDDRVVSPKHRPGDEPPELAPPQGRHVQLDALPTRFARYIYPIVDGIGVSSADRIPDFEFASDETLTALVFVVGGESHIFLIPDEGKKALLTQLAGGLHVVTA
jgi:hypothetical protein